ncbi:SRPBCC family protein [Phycicoccus sp. SLBN-51]|jgi:hypothetical protein|uniref:SRPBCC family protein n=1 Tax=Phycicoccus sp. SLBN-51 TaxID=2768447 RepID=UPI00115252DD|nr:SRPBCC family protein [Phycicoccus sp. SLBN-51]TQJ51121.1 polyketide cyclase/dehydrase/lipid transport protein [Phycicoccus sp. SLBN-51]
MSTTTRLLHCPPEDVFDVLSDGWSYATWVVGAARIRDVDRDWPSVGARIHHSVGAWPLLLSDTTSVEAVEEPHMLQLRARAWPTGEARIVIRCEPQGDATLVTIEEWAASGPAAKVPQGVLDPALHARNVEALKRLAYLAESRARRHDDSGGHGGVPKLRRPGSAADPRDEA